MNQQKLSVATNRESFFTSQVPDFLGLHLIHNPERFLDKWISYAQHITAFDIYSLGISLSTVFIILFWRKVTDRLPGPLIAILVTTGIAHVFHWPLQTIGTRFGSVPHCFPAPHIPHIDWDIIVKMSPPAMTIALLAGIESLLSAVVADGMTGRRHRSNMELIAQGIANLASPLFGGIPATGAIARTATNIKNGGQTPISGIVHALTVMIMFLFLGQWASLIPMATLAGILVLVAYNMGEWSMFAKLFRSPKSDIAVLLATFLLTVFLRMRFVPAMDATGLSALDDLLRKAKKSKMEVIFSGVHAQPLKVMKEGGIIDMLGEDHFHWDIKTCVAFAKKIIQDNVVS